MNHSTFLNSVAAFMAAFKQSIPVAPDISDSATNALRCKLLREELIETADAIRENDRVETLDGLCDSQYVLSGAILAWGYRHSWESVTHKVTLRKIHDMDAHLARMLGIVNHLEIVSQANAKTVCFWRNWIHRTWKAVWSNKCKCSPCCHW